MPIFVISELTQQNDAEFPILDDSKLRGGHRSVQTLTERQAIPMSFRKAGMTVYVVSEDRTYQLGIDLETWTEYNNSGGSTPIPMEKYVHHQYSPSTQWIVNHNLNKYPNVVVVDSSGYEVYMEVYHETLNKTVLSARSPFSGIATLS